MAAQDFFVEIGTEELPPKALKTLEHGPKQYPCIYTL